MGIEAAAFARFGLQVLGRELIATDWVFAVPVVWHRAGGWIRFRYYHTSSHMGDEYARRFEDPGSTSPGMPQRSLSFRPTHRPAGRLWRRSVRLHRTPRGIQAMGLEDRFAVGGPWRKEGGYAPIWRPTWNGTRMRADPGSSSREAPGCRR